MAGILKADDDTLWILTNISSDAVFDEWFQFAIHWIFDRANHRWYNEYAADSKWKNVLYSWWFFVDKKKKNKAIQISAKCIKNATKSIHQICREGKEKGNERMSSGNAQSELFEWLLCLTFNQWESVQKKTKIKTN